MAFGIDDALAAAAGGIKLTTTIVAVIQRYRKAHVDLDLDLLLKEVQITAVKRIDDADLALSQFERMLLDRRINIDRRLADVVADTPFWQPFEQHRLSQIQKRFNEFADSIYCATDDIAALVRCHQQTQEMGSAIVESINAKHQLHAALLDAPSLRRAIALLRSRLAEHKAALGG
jgi:hypothetical protein